MYKVNYNKYDVVIVGKGAAGLSCGIYTARAGLKTLIIGKKPKWATDSHKFENYLGFEKGITGKDLYNNAVKQCKGFGAELLDREVIGIEIDKKNKNRITVRTSNTKYDTTSLLIASGTNIKSSGISGETEFEGRGVHYCAKCDGYAYKNKKVIVVGNSDFAAHEALEILNYTKDVQLCMNGSSSEFSKESLKLLEKNNIPVIEEKVNKISGKQFVGYIELDANNKDNNNYKDNKKKIKVDGVFVAVGTASAIDFALRIGLEIKDNLLLVGAEQNTNIKGVFAAGDCCNKYKQFGVAVGEGIKAGLSIIKYVNNL